MMKAASFAGSALAALTLAACSQDAEAPTDGPAPDRAAPAETAPATDVDAPSTDEAGTDETPAVEPAAAPGAPVESPTIFSVSGDGLAALVKTGEGVSAEETDLGLVLISGVKDDARPSGDLSSVASIRLPDDVETAAVGKTLTVRVTATGGPFRIAYSTNEGGNSGWNAFNATASLEPREFTYDVPNVRTARGDFIGIVATSPAPVAVQEISVSIPD